MKGCVKQEHGAKKMTGEKGMFIVGGKLSWKGQNAKA